MKAIAVIILALVAGIVFWVGGDPRFAAARPAADVPEGAIDNDPNAAPAGKRAPDSEVSIVGEWRSASDPSWVRVFGEDGTVRDEYSGREGAGSSTGVWSLSQLSASKYPRLSVTSGFDGVTTLFGVVAVTATSLELVRLDGGGVLSFIRVG